MTIDPAVAGYGRPVDFPTVGCVSARQHRLDADTFAGEFVLQRKTEAQGHMLWSPVDAVERLAECPRAEAILMIVPRLPLTKAGSGGVGEARERGNVESDHSASCDVGFKRRRDRSDAGLLTSMVMLGRPQLRFHLREIRLC